MWGFLSSYNFNLFLSRTGDGSQMQDTRPILPKQPLPAQLLSNASPIVRREAVLLPPHKQQWLTFTPFTRDHRCVVKSRLPAALVPRKDLIASDCLMALLWDMLQLVTRAGRQTWS
ncbi:hypothetical protein PM082_022560 [Marasmius tenuissimus]|nr:hypothetical protein PM082_022560 [Marasmius tenuissimus]